MSDPQATATAYQVFGGAEGIRTLVDRFYDLMDLDEAAAGIRALHPQSLDGSRQKLFEYLSYWLGGPETYVEKNGHPRMRARHMPFAIGESERDQWLHCMQQAVSETLPAGEVRDKFWEAVVGLADHMRNR
ncbi:group II truncated hemoglobin [Uliginosibacterium sediminicola]|uniref:Group II truncated hemoglobin n=1 Tax=Uliginosibacterium sediminicola TaxID=2024550 RepID=A0ABU9YY59_9RHOO